MWGCWSSSGGVDGLEAGEWVASGVVALGSVDEPDSSFSLEEGGV